MPNLWYLVRIYLGYCDQWMELPFLALPVIFLRILIMLSITAPFIIAMRNDKQL